MTQQTYSANDVLMGGGGAPTAKFANPGDTLEGAIVAPPTVYQERDYDPNNPGGGKPKTYPSGDPIMAVYVDVQTAHRDPSISEDDGVRRFYIEGRYLKTDVRDAIRRAGTNGLEVGGRLKVTFTHGRQSRTRTRTADRPDTACASGPDRTHRAGHRHREDPYRRRPHR
jgi:hypothetical protein